MTEVLSKASPAHARAHRDMAHLRPVGVTMGVGFQDHPARPPAPHVVQVKAGQRVYQTHGLATCCYIVHSGIVRLEKYSAEGERCIAHLLGPGGVFGLDALQQVFRDTDAWACTDVVIQKIPVLRHLGPSAAVDPFHPDLTPRLLRHFHEALEWTAQITRGTARRRVVCLLLRLQTLSVTGQAIWLPSRQEIADMVGITHVTASRIIAQLCREKAVTRVGTHGAMVDDVRLRAETGVPG